MNAIEKAIFQSYVLLKWSISSTLYNIKRIRKPIHILFCLVDHFEPGTKDATFKVEKSRMAELLSKYPLLADSHCDFYGNRPKRTWFFPPHYHRYGNLKELVFLCEKGYGEIELHLHHGKSEPDTSENLEKVLLRCIQEYSKFGIFGTEDGKKKYGFIHGDWALDNSRSGRFCGVNNEISILKRTGCYADFTFPCLNKATPMQINSIFYAIDDPWKPKSHNHGAPVRKNSCNNDGLMIIQGPIHPFFFTNKLSSLRTPSDAINGQPAVCSRRIDCWIETGIHIKGKKDWIILKTHTHGAPYSESVLGQEMDDIFNYLENRYNDGENFILHYVTARELYNIIAAIEKGENGSNPELYRNYRIEKPAYNSSQDIYEASNNLKELILKTYKG